MFLDLVLISKLLVCFALLIQYKSSVEYSLGAIGKPILKSDKALLMTKGIYDS